MVVVVLKGLEVVVVGVVGDGVAGCGVVGWGFISTEIRRLLNVRFFIPPVEYTDY